MFTKRQWKLLHPLFLCKIQLEFAFTSRITTNTVIHLLVFCDAFSLPLHATLLFRKPHPFNVFYPKNISFFFLYFFFSSLRISKWMVSTVCLLVFQCFIYSLLWVPVGRFHKKSYYAVLQDCVKCTSLPNMAKEFLSELNIIGIFHTQNLENSS